MKTTNRAIALILLFLLTANSTMFGWGSIGHMAVAYVAYKQLTPATKARVDALLILNPDHDKWLTMIPPGTKKANRSMVIFMIASTWPDQIKSETGYTDDGPDPHGNRPDGASSSQNIGYSDHLHHKYWHFVDTPFTQDSSTLPAIPSPNAETQIAAFRAVLASNDPDPLKSYDLVWLLHLVGDVHQPLHASTRVSATALDGDNGGNNETVCTAPCTKKGALHAYWDDLPGTGSDPTAAISFAKTLRAQSKTLSGNVDTAVWLQESLDEAKLDVYVAPISVGDGPFTLTTSYDEAAHKLAKKRVALAGARLANILNSELK